MSQYVVLRNLRARMTKGWSSICLVSVTVAWLIVFHRTNGFTRQRIDSSRYPSLYNPACSLSTLGLLHYFRSLSFSLSFSNTYLPPSRRTVQWSFWVGSHSTWDSQSHSTPARSLSLSHSLSLSIHLSIFLCLSHLPPCQTKIPV